MSSSLPASRAPSPERACHQPSTPRHISSILRTNSIHRSETLNQVSSAARPGQEPLPQHPQPTSTSRHSFLTSDGFSPDCLNSTSEPTISSHIRHRSVKRTPSCPRAIRESASCATATRKPMHPAKVQRWAGLTRTVSDWDVLRRDPELWTEEGDCYVHLHARGASRRGPSFCIPFRVLRQKKCSDMLGQCDAQLLSATGSTSQQLRRMPSSLTDPNQETSSIQLFIPHPEHTSRENSFRWHITTRNFFAFLLGKPLVGEHMGQAFVDLQERLQLFRPEHASNQQDFLDYAENLGYRDLVECTDYALASLYYAEHYKLKDVWIDAFAHCVGMTESLASSPEYSLNSRLTKALMAKANLEVDMHLSQVSKALGRFLEDDLSPSHLGITACARSHLDHFRRFLHEFHVEKFGYWPPPRGSTFPKALYKSMYFDFKNLYDYLVDTESSADISAQGPARGGICVLQNISSFDRRQGFKAQSHPLPLLPNYVSSTKKMESQKALRQLTLSSQHNKSHQLHSMSAALAVATNSLSQDIISSKIVQAYMQFERMYAINSTQRKDNISATDARKVRWLVIYGTLQYLVSALRAPKEVRDSETPEYPFCYVAEQSTWNSHSRVTSPVATSTAEVSQENIDDLHDHQRSPFTIQPDCQRGDYFTSKTTSRRGSVEIPAPLKVAVPHRQASFRSFGSRSLSMRSSRSSRSESLILKPTPHCAIIVHGYGDGLNEATATLSSQEGPRPVSSVYSRPVSSVCSERSSWSMLPDGASPDSSWLRSRTPSAPHSRKPSNAGATDDARSRTPLLDFTQLEKSADPRVVSEPPCCSDSTASTASSIWSEGASVASSKSSADGEQYIPFKASTAEHSGLLGGLVSVGGCPILTVRTQPLTRGSVPQSHMHPLLRQVSHKDGFDFNFNFNAIGQTHGDAAPSTNKSAIGMAFSAPPSPPTHAFPDLQLTSPSHRAMSLTSEKRPFLLPRTISVDSTSSKNGRATNASSSLAPTSEMWEQYKTTLTRPEGRSGSSSYTDSTPPPIAKRPHAFKVPSFRSASRMSNQEDGIKKEKRQLSLLWRRKS